MKKTLSLLFLLCLNSFYSQVPTYVPTSGLVAYYPFNGNANDVSGNGNNGTNSGAILINDRLGNSNSAYNFDGIQSKIIIAHSASLSIQNTITISAWVNSSSSISNGTIIVKGEESQYWNYGLGLYNSKPQYDYTGFGLGINKVLNPLEWHNVVVTIDTPNNIMVLYVDGVSYNPIYNTSNNTIVNNFNNLINSCCNSSITIGRNNGGTGGAAFNGKIDDIGIWNRVLTQQEITNLYYADSTCQSLVINTGLLSFNPPTYTNTVTIYPNPANDHITIDCGTLANVSGWNIVITNTLGQEVFNQPMNTQQYVVPLNTWSGQGVYFVKIYNAQGILVNTKKIILQ